MKDFFKNIRYFISYIIALFFCFIIRISPRFIIRFYASLAAGCVYLMPSALKICCANIRVAFPEWNDRQVRSVAKKSIRGVILNFLEFIWMSDIPRRIERVCYVSDEVLQLLNECTQSNTRMI